MTPRAPGDPVIEAQVWARVLRFVGERQRPGTAFLVDQQNEQFLVTARHLCSDEPEEVVSLQHAWSNNGAPFQLTLRRVAHDVDPEVDVAAFHLPARLVSVDLLLPMGTDGMAFSQDIYILGYPYGMSFRPGGADQHLAIAKKGIVAGTTVIKGTTTLLLDVYANPGFSGGPVIYRHQETDRLRVAGVVKGQFSGPAEGTSAEGASVVKIPSGISVAVDSLYLLPLLHPA